MAPLWLDYTVAGDWVLLRDLEYVHHRYGKITVPKGFVTDLDSVPRLPFAYLLAKNASVTASVVHDYLYRTGKIGKHEISRAEADRIFLDAMEEEKVSWWQRRLVWFGVRFGGWLPWGRYRKEDVE